MPTIFEPKDLKTTEQDGTRISILANQAMLGVDALQVEHIALEAGSRTQQFEAANAERFIYVVRGRGQAHVAKDVFPLEAESLLWLEKSESFYLAAEADGLEVLLSRAPAE